jgi:putative phosphoesterase
MRVAVLSDIHDNLWKLAPALDFARNCGAMICCGDLCSPFVIDELANSFQSEIHIVFGNNDADLFRITAKSAHYPHVHIHGELCEITLGGKNFGVNHFDYIAKPLAESKRYDVVCFGHNHEFEITQIHSTLALNPGPIMGAKFGAGGREDVPSTFIVYDTASGKPQGFRVGDDAKNVYAI